MTVLVDKNILRLDVSVYDTVPVDFLDGKEELGQVHLRLLFCQSLKGLLIDDRSHVTSWAIVGHHVQVFERLECIVQLCYESVVNLPLDLFFSDYKSCEPVVGTLFHALHCIEFSRALFFGIQALN